LVFPTECPYQEREDGSVVGIHPVYTRHLAAMHGDHHFAIRLPMNMLQPVSKLTWLLIALSMARKWVATLNWLRPYWQMELSELLSQTWVDIWARRGDYFQAATVLGEEWLSSLGLEDILEYLTSVETLLTWAPFATLLYTHLIPSAVAYAIYKADVFWQHHFKSGLVALVLSWTLKFGEFSIGLGERHWWYTGRASHYVGCGPVRPDTLYGIPRPSALSYLSARCPHTVFVPHDQSMVYTAAGWAKTTRRTQLLWSPVTKEEVDGTWCYSFATTGRTITWAGGVWDQCSVVRTRVVGYDALPFQGHCKPGAKCSMVLLPEGNTTAPYMQMEGFPDMRLPAKTFMNASRVSTGSPSKQAVVESLRNVLTTPSQTSPTFFLEPGQILAWTEYFLDTYHVARTHSDVKFAARKSKGDCVSWEVERPLGAAPRQCNVCHGWAPLKYSWRHSMCPSCYLLYNGQINAGYESQLYSDPHVQYPRDPGTKTFPSIVFLTPCEANEKVKPPRPAAVFGGTQEEVVKAKLGFTSSARVKVPIECKSALVGIGLATRVSTFSSSYEVEASALRTRLFAQPITSTTAADYEGLWKFMVRAGLLGDEVTIRERQVFANVRDWPEPELRHPDFARQLEVYETETGHDAHGDGTKPSWISTFPPARREQFWRSLAKFPLEKVRFSFFVKKEFAILPPRWGCEAPDQVNPRVICSPDDASHCVMGPDMRDLTGQLHRLWNPSNWVTYAGGLTPPEMLCWLNQEVSPDCMSFVRGPGHIAVENDFSKFDCTYSRHTLNFVQKVYKYWGVDVTKGQREVVWRGWRKPKGYTRSGRLVVGPIMNASGRDDTALMNALINGGVQAYAYASVLLGLNHPEEATDAQIAWVKENVRLIVLGDDSLAIVPITDLHKRRWQSSDVSRVVDYFGFEARDMKTHSIPCQAVFLGCRPYPALDDSNQLIASWGPTIGRRAVRISCCREPTGRHPFAWLRGVMVSASLTYSHVPFLSDLVQRNLELCPGRQTTPHLAEDDDAHKTFMFSRGLQMAPEVWTCMNEVYGVSKWQWILFRQRLQAISSLPAVVIDPALEGMVVHDT